ncbi:MAG: RagB/SusD family nutrient uptake outer membrane protein [Cyclobacteriaceae bacterium]|nr:RagB/SusD family nutrient uptake outer membrane protein [Cyclobacteriaceae bacterium]
MKRINLKLSALFSAALLVGSCTNLDEKLNDTWTDANFGKGQELDALLLAPYSNLFGFFGHNGYFTLQEVTTDEAMIPQRGGDWYDGGQPAGMHTHSYAPNYDAVNNLWTAAYAGVSACNRLLANPAVTDAAAIAELKAVRAFYYWVLMDNFGRVPVTTKLGEAKPQSSRAEVFAFIESELLSTLEPLKDVKTNYAHMTVYTVHALLAKLYLNAGVYTGTTQYTKAAEQADAVLAGPFELEAKYFDVFKATNNGSKEHIWVVPYDRSFGTGFNLAQMTLHYGSQDTYKLTAQPWNGYCSLEEFYNSYDDADARKKNNFVVGTQYKYGTTDPVTDGSAEANDPDGAILNFTPTVNELAPNALRQAGARIGKYEFAIGSQPDLDNDFPIFRLGDILLVKAEASFRAGGSWNNTDATGLLYLNKIRNRAGLPDVNSVTEDEFLAERGREVFAEAWRRNDLIRFGKYGQPWFGKNASDNADGHLNVFPIPIAQITATSGTPTALTQNPGYPN